MQWLIRIFAAWSAGGLMLLAVVSLAGALAALTTLAMQPAADANAAPGRRAARAEPAVERAPEQLSVDEAFLQARQAMNSENLPRFEALAVRASEHRLAAYVRYWGLKLRLADRGPQDEGALDTRVRQYLAAEGNTVAADLLRRDWMLNLGRRSEWAVIEAQYALWVLRDDNQANCYHLAARAHRGATVGPAARALLAQTREFGDGCNTLLDLLTRNGTFRREDLQRLLATALESNSAGNVRRIAMQLTLDADKLEQALTKPARIVGNAGSPELELIALSRLARQDTSAAAERLPAIYPVLNAQQRQFAQSQVAAAMMRKLDPEALRWSRDTLGLAADGRGERNATARTEREGGQRNLLIGDETWVWLARAALRGQDWRMLPMVIDRMSPEMQRESTWIYWLARAQAAIGNKTDAEQLWKTIAGQHHFYGQLAGEELGRLTTVPARAESARAAEMAEIEANPGFARAVDFYALGLRMEGNREWNYQLRGMNDRQLLAAAQWACQRKILDRCVNTADRTSSEHDFALRFVTPFREELTPIAKENGLEPDWVYGLIRQESRFIMDARSSVGASGLMQIMPATGRWIARKLGVTDFTVDQLSELPTNLRFGTFYLKSVLDDLDGSPLLASAAYNAGPNRSRNWRASLSAPVEGAIFAEIIPFGETRDYVKKVLSNATYYAALFSGQPQSLKQRLGSVAPKPAGQTELP